MKSCIVSVEVTGRADVQIEAPPDKEKALGIVWSPEKDCFHFEVKLNFSPKEKKQRIGPYISREQISGEIPDLLMKRMILC